MKLASVHSILHAVNLFQRTGLRQQLIVIKSDVPVINAILIKFIF